MLSSHHFGASVSLTLSLLEFKERNGAKYSKKVIEDSKRLAVNLHNYGFDVKTHRDDLHLGTKFG